MTNVTKDQIVKAKILKSLKEKKHSDYLRFTITIIEIEIIQ